MYTIFVITLLEIFGGSENETYTFLVGDFGSLSKHC
ncbi:MAG: hypothetical protein PWP49_1231 [Thermococcaceae archaeon]|nr:MAG: hypothetical protein XD43_1677 [Thermococcales archaeon 44_46]MDK2783497.1 hypothetical protein [Thermococcaceae archaeon]MDK2854210.1 hypothetical protein [Thermococcaceae archaeon]MDN5320811.1 hypothetical protein [Thermococcaceae archaeon]